MTITIDPKLETYLREHAEFSGLTVEAYVERLVAADQSAEQEITALALEGIQSGDPIEVSAEYWAEKHRRLDQRFSASGPR
jgi:antitoxin ParD1/3/4